MYYVYVTSGPSLHIESTDSMIMYVINTLASFALGRFPAPSCCDVGSKDLRWCLDDPERNCCWRVSDWRKTAKAGGAALAGQANSESLLSCHHRVVTIASRLNVKRTTVCSWLCNLLSLQSYTNKEGVLQLYISSTDLSVVPVEPEPPLCLGCVYEEGDVWLNFTADQSDSTTLVLHLGGYVW